MAEYNNILIKNNCIFSILDLCYVSEISANAEMCLSIGTPKIKFHMSEKETKLC